MGEIIKLDNICQYNEMVGQETLHPLVSVLDLSKSSRMMKHVRMSYGFYAVFLKEVKCGDLRYGRNYYDYQEGTLVFLAPGQVIGSEENAEKLVDVESFKRVVVNYDNPPYTDTILTAYTDVNKAINEYTRYAHQGLMTAEEAMAQAKQIADEAIKNAD